MTDLNKSNRTVPVTPVINTATGSSVALQTGVPSNQSYVELSNDLLFHMVFTKNQEALKGLLASLLNLNPADILKIELLNPMQYNDSIGTKQTVLDLKLHLNDSSYILVEMQVRDYPCWTNRALIYACREIVGQTDGKNAYEKLQPVVQISIMKYTLFPDNKQFFAEYKIRAENLQVLTDKLRFIVLDLTASESATQEDKDRKLKDWADAFNASDWETVRSIDNPSIKEAVKTMEMILSNPSERDRIWERKMAIMDYNTGLIGAELRGEERGMKLGAERGMKLGAERETKRIARNLKDKGMPISDISSITGLSSDEIARL